MRSQASTTDSADANEHERERADLPLSEGTLWKNIGVPIVFVCAKADYADELVRERRLSEAHLDYVQQVLRTIALLYGAAVIATTQKRPESFETLRTYAAHRLFATPSAASPSTLELSTLFAPSGWDTWTKIEVLGDACEPRAYADKWHDTGAVCRMYEEKVPAQRLASAADRNTVELEDEQLFLARLHGQQSTTGNAPYTLNQHDIPTKNVVGPALHASTLDMPRISSALEQPRADGEKARAPASMTPAAKKVVPPDASSPATPQQTEVLHNFFQSRTSAVAGCDSRAVLKKPGQSPGGDSPASR